MLKKALLWDEDRNQIKPRAGFLQFNVKTKKVCICFASFSSEQEHFAHDVYIAALYSSFGLKKRTYNVLWRNDAKNFRRNSALAIAVVVMSRSSTFEYTMSIHAVHAGTERKFVLYCSIYWNTPNHHQSISNATPRVQTSTFTPTPLKSSPPRPPHSLLCRCATDVSIRSCPSAQIYLKCILFIYMYMCQ